MFLVICIFFIMILNTLLIKKIVTIEKKNPLIVASTEEDALFPADLSHKLRIQVAAR